MLLDLAPGDRARPVHVLCNDTLVESPVLTAFIERMLTRLQLAAENLHLPITVVKTTPDPDHFWEALDATGLPSPDRKLTRVALMSEQVFRLFTDHAFREQARLVLIANYFLPREQLALAATLGILESELGASALAIAAIERETAAQKGRDVRFRLVVVAAYSFTCCLTRHRLTTITRGSMVDAAHIHQFADSRNDDPRNGIALSKNAHWMFDQGLWTILDDYTVKIAHQHFAEDNPQGRALAAYEGESILLPVDAGLRPDPSFLAWHRKK